MGMERRSNMNSRQVRLVAALGVALGLGIVSLLPSVALGQTGAATLTGTVRDAEQKVVPGASVTITNSETNVSHTGQTSEVGIYYFGGQPRGPYTLAVENDG